MAELDPGIILGVKPPLSPQDSRLKSLQVQNAALEQQAHRQQIAGGALDMQVKQREIDSDAATRKLFADSPNPSDSAIMSTAGPARGAVIIKSRMDANHARAQFQETQAKLAQQENDLGGAEAAVVAAQNYSPESLQGMLRNMTQLGYGEHAKQIAAVVEQDPSQAKTIIDGMITKSKEQQELSSQRATAVAREKTAQTGADKLTAELPGIKAKGEQQARENAAAQLGAATTAEQYAKVLDTLPHGLAKAFPPAEQFDPQKTPAIVRQLGMTADQQATTTQTAKRDAATAEHANREETRQTRKDEWEKANSARRLVLEGGRLSVEQGRLQIAKQQLGFMENGGVSSTAAAAAKGDLDPATIRQIIRRNPGIVAQIKAVDPNFDEANIEKRYNTLKEFTSSSNAKAGGQVIALNTLIHHADLYLAAAEALKNGSFTPGNAAYNAVASAFGSAPPSNAALVARFLAGETGKVATGGVPAEGEVKGVLKSLSTSSSPDQIAGAARTILGIAAGRMIPLQEKVTDSKLEGVVHLLGPDAQDILKRGGYDPQTMKKAAAPKVKLQAPNNGPVTEVPADQAGHYLRLGAKRVQ